MKDNKIQKPRVNAVLTMGPDAGNPLVIRARFFWYWCIVIVAWLIVSAIGLTAIIFNMWEWTQWISVILGWIALTIGTLAFVISIWFVILITLGLLKLWRRVGTLNNKYGWQIIAIIALIIAGIFIFPLFIVAHIWFVIIWKKIEIKAE